ncbi:hypothetical protein HZY91_00445 [Facklamia sp. DSM 111018]|uniref:Gram-positive cocci surface proteins LPxTG domain-containing protein n=1 Tax=Facklamia lactis TaxID=2749967 RepID=A0ABS0LMK0_9LACT|nr:hypothetical protein [Facklamia lactis]MBG9985357.1 hypothetical protein [Facklamia lactis]
MNKRKWNFGLIIVLLLSSIPCDRILASESDIVREPYILTRQINNQPVDLGACQILLREDSNSGASNEDVDLAAAREQLTANQTRMAAINERYQVINDEIAQLETGESNSLEEAEKALEAVIETVYQDYLVNETDFASLNAEEQLALVSQNLDIVEWQNYIDSLIEIINSYISEKADLELEYEQLAYDNDNLSQTLDASKVSEAQLNQCQLYPYSSKIIPKDQLMINQQSSTLSEYLLEIDHYLQELIPLAYRKVTFDDIYNLFNRQITREEIADLLQGKEQVVIDEEAFQIYQYAKELSLFDIEIVATMALDDYYRNSSIEVYKTSYNNMLNLKEGQLAYFYQLNVETLDYMKEQLAEYLNSHALFSDEVIREMQAFHQRYQLKLVLYDDQSQTWMPYLGGQSGYLDDFSSRELLHTPRNNDSTEETTNEGRIELDEHIINEDESNKIQDSSLSSTPEHYGDDHLAYLKDKLDNKSKINKHTNGKDIAKPLKKEKKYQKEDEVDKPKGKSKLSLPTTGEQRFYLLLSGIFLLAGLILLAINRYIKYRKIKELQANEEDWI